VNASDPLTRRLIPVIAGDPLGVFCRSWNSRRGTKLSPARDHLSANRKLALRTPFASALVPRVPEGASACFGALAGMWLQGQWRPSYASLCDSCCDVQVTGMELLRLRPQGSWTSSAVPSSFGKAGRTRRAFHEERRPVGGAGALLAQPSRRRSRAFLA
jgi:hypothetical protein